MARIERGNHFMSGFGNENFIEEFYMDRGKGLSSGTIFSENDDAYKLEIGIPNVDKKDVGLQLSGNELIITGIKPGNPKIEKPENEFRGVFFIPMDVNANKISASVKDGLLTLNMPKKPMERVSQPISVN